MFRWNALKDEQLLRVLKDYRNVWSTRHPGFTNYAQKYKSIHEISEILQIPLVEVKKRILFLQNDILFEIRTNKRTPQTNLKYKNDDTYDFLYEEMNLRDSVPVNTSDSKNTLLFNLVVKHECLVNTRCVTKAEKDVAKEAWMQVAEDYKNQLVPNADVNHVRKKFHVFLNKISKKMERFLSAVQTKSVMPSDCPNEFEKTVVKYFPRVLINAQRLLKDFVGENTDKEVVFSEPIDYSCLNEEDDIFEDNSLDNAVMDKTPSSILPDNSELDELSNNSTSCSSYLNSLLPDAATMEEDNDVLNLGEFDDVGYQVIDVDSGTSFQLSEEELDVMELRSLATGQAADVAPHLNSRLSLMLTKVLSRQTYADIIDNTVTLHEDPKREVYNENFWKMVASEFADNGFRVKPLYLKKCWDEIMSSTRSVQERIANGPRNIPENPHLFWYTLLTFPLLFTTDVIAGSDDKDSASSQNPRLLGDDENSQEFILPDEEYLFQAENSMDDSGSQWTNNRSAERTEMNSTVNPIRHPKPVILPNRAEVMEMNKRLQTASVPPTIASKNNILDKTNKNNTQSSSKTGTEKQKFNRPAPWQPNRNFLQMPAWMTRPKKIMSSLPTEPIQVFTENKKPAFTKKDEDEVYNNFLEVLKNVPTQETANPFTEDPEPSPSTSGKGKAPKKYTPKQPKVSKKRTRQKLIDEEMSENSLCSEDTVSQISDESQNSINSYIFEELPKKVPAKRGRKKIIRDDIRIDSPAIDMIGSRITQLFEQENNVRPNSVITLDMTNPNQMVMTGIPKTNTSLSESKLKKLLESSNINIETVPQSSHENIDFQNIPVLSIPDNIEPEELSRLIATSSVASLTDSAVLIPNNNDLVLENPPISNDSVIPIHNSNVANDSESLPLPVIYFNEQVSSTSDTTSIHVNSATPVSGTDSTATDLQDSTVNDVSTTNDVQNSTIVSDSSSLQPFDTSTLEESAKSCNIDLRSYYSMISDCLDDIVVNEDDANVTDLEPGEIVENSESVEQQMTTDENVKNDGNPFNIQIKVLKTLPKRNRYPVCVKPSDLRVCDSITKRLMKIVPMNTPKYVPKLRANNINNKPIKILPKTVELKNENSVSEWKNANNPNLGFRSPPKPIINVRTKDVNRPSILIKQDILTKPNSEFPKKRILIKKVKGTSCNAVMDSLRKKGLTIQTVRSLQKINLNKILSDAEKNNERFPIMEKLQAYKVRSRSKKSCDVITLDSDDDDESTSPTKSTDDSLSPNKKLDDSISIDSEDDNSQSEQKNTDRTVSKNTNDDSMSHDSDDDDRASPNKRLNDSISIDSEDDESQSASKNTDNAISENTNDYLNKSIDDSRSHDGDDDNQSSLRKNSDDSPSKKNEDSISIDSQGDESLSVHENTKKTVSKNTSGCKNTSDKNTGGNKNSDDKNTGGDKNKNDSPTKSIVDPQSRDESMDKFVSLDKKNDDSMSMDSEDDEPLSLHKNMDKNTNDSINKNMDGESSGDDEPLSVHKNIDNAESTSKNRNNSVSSDSRVENESTGGCKNTNDKNTGGSKNKSGKKTHGGNKNADGKSKNTDGYKSTEDKNTNNINTNGAKNASDKNTVGNKNADGKSKNIGGNKHPSGKNRSDKTSGGYKSTEDKNTNNINTSGAKNTSDINIGGGKKTRDKNTGGDKNAKNKNTSGNKPTGGLKNKSEKNTGDDKNTDDKKNPGGQKNTSDKNTGGNKTVGGLKNKSEKNPGDDKNTGGQKNTSDKNIGGNENTSDKNTGGNKNTNKSMAIAKNLSDSKTVKKNIVDSVSIDSSDEDDVPLSKMTKQPAKKTCKDKKSISDSLLRLQRLNLLYRDISF